MFRAESKFEGRNESLFHPFPSAAGRGRDGAVEEGALSGGGVHGDGDGEVEDGAAATAAADGRAARLRGARGRRGQDLGLELKELAHEAEVGRDDAAALLDEFEGLVQLDAVGAHEVGQADGGGTGDAGLAMHEHAASFAFHRVWRGDKRRVRINTHQKSSNFFLHRQQTQRF